MQTTGGGGLGGHLRQRHQEDILMALSNGQSETGVVEGWCWEWSSPQGGHSHVGVSERRMRRSWTGSEGGADKEASEGPRTWGRQGPLY